MKETKRKDKSASKKRRNNEKEGIELVNHLSIEGKRVGANEDRKKREVPRSKKRKSEKIAEAEVTENDKDFSGPDDGSDVKLNNGMKDKKKKRNKKKMEAGVHKLVEQPSGFKEDTNQQIGNEDGTNVEKKKRKLKRSRKQSEKLAEVEIAGSDEVFGGQDDGFDGTIKTGTKDKKKKRNKEKSKETGVYKVVRHSDKVGEDSNQQSGKQDDANDEKRRSKALKNKTRKSKKLAEAVTTEIDTVYSGLADGLDGKTNTGMKYKKKMKLKKKKRNKEKTKDVGVYELVQLSDEVGGDSNKESGESKNVCKTQENGHSSQKDANLLENSKEAEEDDVYEMSSGDEDYSTGMAKWLNDYRLASPGVEVLQKRIDDWLANYEAQQEQARKEREAQAAEGGWTVVAHQKGRKKTTDAETGVTVGSVAQAAVMDKMAKKKNKEVGLDFYRFQRREAQRNEIMMLQSKFEEDKKRIQQMRAARKFRPY